MSLRTGWLRGKGRREEREWKHVELAVFRPLGWGSERRGEEEGLVYFLNRGSFLVGGEI